MFKWGERNFRREDTAKKAIEDEIAKRMQMEVNPSVPFFVNEEGERYIVQVKIKGYTVKYVRLDTGETDP